MKKLRSVCFDFDGTLIDTIPLIIESYQYVYREIGKYVPTEDEIISGIGLPLETIFAQDFPAEQIPEALEMYLDYNRPRLASHVAIYLGIIPLLEALSSLDLKLGIVTAKRGSDMVPTMRAFRLEKYFDTIVSKFDTEEHKPKPAPLYLAMERLEISDPQELLYIGDAIYDIQSANNAGCLSGAVAWSNTSREKLQAQSPTVFFDQWQDILEFVKKRI
ncbi:MAG: HAD-IA family hydrolase [Eubacteriales bacterium]|nr:HAD-IA family hydrolase [Eubacteriales bacterium]